MEQVHQESPVRLLAVIHIATTYFMVVNHDTTLSIMSLHISHMLLICFPGVVLPPPFLIDLPSEAHASPG
jgi:hypothetical protein